MSSFGSGEAAKKASLGTRILLYCVIAKRLFDDKALAERALAVSKLDRTILYPVTLKTGPAIPQSDVVSLHRVAKVPGLPVLPFANVARELVRLATIRETSGQRMLITTPNGWMPIR